MSAHDLTSTWQPGEAGMATHLCTLAFERPGAVALTTMTMPSSIAERRPWQRTSVSDGRPVNARCF
jgi:hypothetical protein